MNKSKITATDENKNNKKMKSYLGQKGYTLHKEHLTVEEQTFIRRELTVRPFMPVASKTPGVPSLSRIEI